MTSPTELQALIKKTRALRRLPLPADRQRIRLEAGITQQELASALGASRVSVSRWEKVVRLPRGDKAFHYALALQQLASKEEGS